MDLSFLGSHPELKIGFGILVIIMLLLDLGVFNKKAHEVTMKEASIWTVVWISLAMAFSGVVYWVYNNDAGGHELAVEKFTQFQNAYWVEKALSVDNLFVFILVFSYFKVPSFLHHKVLFWGIIGALVFRAIFIFAGVWLIDLSYLPSFELFGFNFGLDPHNESLKADWINKDFFKINVILTLFGLFLIYAGIKSWKEASEEDEDEEKDFGNSFGARVVRKFFKVTDKFDGTKFFTIENGVKMATPLLTVIVVIEISDLMFAVDSIPAIFAISKDPFILYTSNIFAILGLRSLYFLLANFIHMFSKLPYGLAFVLSFIGFKMLAAPFIHIPSEISLGIVASVLIISVVVSIMFPDKENSVEIN
ncbi:TerC family protein [Empedobacter falsenii]